MKKSLKTLTVISVLMSSLSAPQAQAYFGEGFFNASNTLTCPANYSTPLMNAAPLVSPVAAATYFDIAKSMSGELFTHMATALDEAKVGIGAQVLAGTTYASGVMSAAQNFISTQSATAFNTIATNAAAAKEVIATQSATAFNTIATNAAAAKETIVTQSTAAYTYAAASIQPYAQAATVKLAELQVTAGQYATAISASPATPYVLGAAAALTTAYVGYKIFQAVTAKAPVETAEMSTQTEEILSANSTTSKHKKANRKYKRNGKLRPQW